MVVVVSLALNTPQTWTWPDCRNATTSTSLRIDDKWRPGGDGTEVEDAVLECDMSDYRLVVVAEDGGGDALYWSSPLSVRVNDLMHSMELILFYGGKIQAMTWGKQ